MGVTWWNQYYSTIDRWWWFIRWWFQSLIMVQCKGLMSHCEPLIGASSRVVDGGHGGLLVMVSVHRKQVVTFLGNPVAWPPRTRNTMLRIGESWAYSDGWCWSIAFALPLVGAVSYNRLMIMVHARIITYHYGVVMKMLPVTKILTVTYHLYYIPDCHENTDCLRLLVSFLLKSSSHSCHVIALRLWWLIISLITTMYTLVIMVCALFWLSVFVFPVWISTIFRLQTMRCLPDDTLSSDSDMVSGIPICKNYLHPRLYMIPIALHSGRPTWKLKMTSFTR